MPRQLPAVGGHWLPCTGAQVPESAPDEPLLDELEELDELLELEEVEERLPELLDPPELLVELPPLLDEEP
jgi:hypothetical protein